MQPVPTSAADDAAHGPDAARTITLARASR